MAKSHAVLQDTLKQDPVRGVLNRERTAVVKHVFGDYSKTQEGFESLSALYLHFHEDQPVSVIAQWFATYDRKIFRVLSHDCEALRDLFAQSGIRSLQDILAE
jgi:hypothetical protein